MHAPSVYAADAQRPRPPPVSLAAVCMTVRPSLRIPSSSCLLRGRLHTAILIVHAHPRSAPPTPSTPPSPRLPRRCLHGGAPLHMCSVLLVFAARTTAWRRRDHACTPSIRAPDAPALLESALPLFARECAPSYAFCDASVALKHAPISSFVPSLRLTCIAHIRAPDTQPSKGLRSPLSNPASPRTHAPTTCISPPSTCAPTSSARTLLPSARTPMPMPATLTGLPPARTLPPSAIKSHPRAELNMHATSPGVYARTSLPSCHDPPSNPCTRQPQHG
ncbi:hypothetical protein OF83DRAFT_1178531 [Amylostereum chailletii]|nr:hypothetical protein OF83DRAFT_1178531 [Amylostereum chailletii]